MTEHHFMSWDTSTGEAGVKPAPASLLLDAGETRVLGALIEKEVATPAYYPLSLNALVNACNQRTNRRPVTALSAGEVTAILNRLKEKRFVSFISGGSNQVTKYRQNLTRVYSLGPEEVAVLCVLMLRGALTPGEIRQTSASLYEFEDLEKVDSTLERMAELVHGPMVARLARQPGQKEVRFSHLLAGAPAEITDSFGEETAGPVGDALPMRSPSIHEDVAALKEIVLQLQAESESLREELAALRARFEALQEQLGG